MSLRVWYNLHSDSVQENNLRFETVRRTTHGDVDISVTPVGACDKNMDALFLTKNNHSPGPWRKQRLVSKNCESQMFQPVNCLNPTCISPGVLVSDMEERRLQSDCLGPGVQCLGPLSTCGRLLSWVSLYAVVTAPWTNFAPCPVVFPIVLFMVQSRASRTRTLPRCTLVSTRSKLRSQRCLH